MGNPAVPSHATYPFVGLSREESGRTRSNDMPHIRRPVCLCRRGRQHRTPNDLWKHLPARVLQPKGSRGEEPMGNPAVPSHATYPFLRLSREEGVLRSSQRSCLKHEQLDIDFLQQRARVQITLPRSFHELERVTCVMKDSPVLRTIR